MKYLLPKTWRLRCPRLAFSLLLVLIKIRWNVLGSNIRSDRNASTKSDRIRISIGTKIGSANRILIGSAWRRRRQRRNTPDPKGHPRVQGEEQAGQGGGAVDGQHGAFLGAGGRHQWHQGQHPRLHHPRRGRGEKIMPWEISRKIFYEREEVNFFPWEKSVEKHYTLVRSTRYLIWGFCWTKNVLRQHECEYFFAKIVSQNGFRFEITSLNVGVEIFLYVLLKMLPGGKTW